MKNIHLIPTEKPSVLRVGDNGNFVFGLAKTYIQSRSDCFTNQHIYITSDEEIKERDWVIAIEGIWKNTITKITGTPITDVWRKIILTTDYDLIAEGVQAIDDEFLWWFSENPSCEFVEVVDMSMQYHDEGYYEYKIIIPQEEPKQECSQLGTKELNDLASAFFAGKLNHLASAYFGGEPKQETLEEAAEKLYLSHENNELLYGHSEDLQLAYKAGILDGAEWQAERMYSELELEVAFFEGRENNLTFIEWFEQFKKK